MTDHRAAFDFRIQFTNGGDLTGTGFRIDVPGPQVGEDEVGALLVRSLGLLMSGPVEIRNLRIVEESHIPIVEHLRNLAELPPSGFRFHAAPPRVEQFGTFPVRAYAIIP